MPTTDELDARLTTLEGVVTGKADHPEVDTIAESVTSKADAAELTALSSLVAVKATIAALNAVIADRDAADADLQAQIDDRVDSATFAALQSDVSGKADHPEVDALAGSVATLQAAVDDFVASGDLVPSYWRFGTGVPSGSLGAVNDFYLRSGTWDVYQKTGPTTWTLRGSIRGPEGITGSAGADGVPPAWRADAGAPGTSLGIVGDWYLNLTNGDVYQKTGSAIWTLRGNIRGPRGLQGIQGETGPQGPGIASVNGDGGPDVVLDKTDIGLGNVNNTSDANKPVSTFQQAALDLKQDLDSNLTGLSDLTIPTQASGGTAKRIIYTTGSDNTTGNALMGITPITSFTETLLQRSTAAAARVDLETPTIKTGTISTGQTTTAKTVTISGYTLTAGDILALTLTNGNSTTSSTPTLNVNGGGAVPIIHSSTNTYSYETVAGGVWLLYYNGTSFVLSGALDGIDQIFENRLSTGTGTYPRELAVTDTTTVSGRINLSYFTAGKEFTATQLRTYTGTTGTSTGTPAPTLCKMGLYLVNSDLTLTLLSATANDTTLWATASAAYTLATTSSMSITRGTRYAFATLVITTGVLPNIVGMKWSNGNLGTGTTPRLVANYTGQTDLPASLAAPSGATTDRPYGVVMP